MGTGEPWVGGSGLGGGCPSGGLERLLTWALVSLLHLRGGGHHWCPSSVRRWGGETEPSWVGRGENRRRKTAALGPSRLLLSCQQKSSGPWSLSSVISPSVFSDFPRLTQLRVWLSARPQYALQDKRADSLSEMWCYRFKENTHLRSTTPRTES